MTSLKSKKFSILHVVVFSVITAVTTISLLHFYNKSQEDFASNSKEATYCNFNVKRMSGFKYIKPILWVDEDCESDQLVGTKQRINDLIEKYKTYEGVVNASVYLRSNNEWTVVNENEKYEPGSLFKVPILITILKMDEETPGFLKKVVSFNKLFDEHKTPTYPSKSIQFGHSYTIKELLEYMIKYSDNNATSLLNEYMKTKTFQKLFSDLGVEVPNVYGKGYLFSVRDYSLFMRTIFNAGYLTTQNSEFAAELLSECEFKDGIAKGLPANIKMAHKFGESGNQTEKQLHESALVFLDNNGYLLTVMTKGNDMKKLSELIGEISALVYNDVKNTSN